MPSAERTLRQAIVRACQEMNASGVNQGTSGNISARWRDGVLITPSGIPYAALKPSHIVRLAMDGKLTGRHAPSSEWRFHRDILARRAEVGAVVHTHSPAATALAICGREIPAVHYMIAAAGGPTIRCAAYATYGTQKLSDNALKALKGRTACLLANHGVIATGPTVEKALWLASEVETLARQYVLALKVGKPRILSNAEIARVVSKFETYGPQALPQGNSQ